ncbi:MAG TPA: sigma 54-interacting transcriptional regulator [Anaeromyxobacteraceae bacterium]|nr:sigma 54-interacting transcriptional regulator [Anaeromyxobacteraceae bacterium]
MSGVGRRGREAVSPELDVACDDDVLRLAASTLAEFGAELAASGHVLSFFDADGWMRWIGGSPRNAERLAELGFRPGERCHYPAGPTTGSEPRAPLEVISDRRWRCAEGWVSSVAPIARPSSPAPAAFVKVAAPPQLARRQVVTARAIAHVLQERLQSAITVREHVVDYAMGVAAGAHEVAFAIDTAGRLIGATGAARRRLLDGGQVPAVVRARLADLLTGAAGRGPRLRVIDWPGGPLRMAVSIIRYHDQAVGAVIRAGAEGRRARDAPEVHALAALARYDFDRILGESEALRAAIALGRTAARNDLPVVLLGESGTGKELFAHAIHSASARRAGPLVAVNCGCLPASLLEAELFGYEAGTFTGGRPEGKAGKVEEAHGGTLLLDEVTELPPQGQVALLRVLQEREVVRLGGSAPRAVDVRVVAATNKSLRAEISAGRFRADLYFRLHVLAIPVPPLRERGDDVKLLAGAFLRDAEAELGRSGLVLSPAALAALQGYDWPGNVRELRNVVLRCAATAAQPVIDASDLAEEVRSGSAATQPTAAATAHAAGAEPRPDDLLRALASSSSWNVAHAAAALRVSRTTLYRWLRKYHIER